MNKKIKEDEYGLLEWKETENGNGYWSRIEDKSLTQFRIPLSCPCCELMLDHHNANYYNRYGVCANCFFDYLEGRENLPNFKNNQERLDFCKEKRSCDNNNNN